MNKIKGIILLILIIIGTIGFISSKRQNISEENDIEEPQTKVALYYVNQKGGELVKEYRYIKLSKAKEDLAGTILEELLKGPINKELINPIPKNTKINFIKKEKNKIVVDFSNEYLEGDEIDFEKLQKVYVVVNSLTEIMEINQVEIDVEGKFYIEKERL